MKIRTDFVTNSSSSNFTVMIDFELKDGQKISFEGYGGTDYGPGYPFDSEALVNVSPKVLGTAKTVEKMIDLLINGVIDDRWNSPEKVFASGGKGSYFIDRLRNSIHSMNDIRKITIRGDEENYVSYLRSYTYNLESGKYTGKQYGDFIEKDGGSGGDLTFDVSDCDVEYFDDSNLFFEAENHKRNNGTNSGVNRDKEYISYDRNNPDDPITNLSSLVNELQGIMEKEGLGDVFQNAFFNSAIGDTGYDLYKWTFTEGKTAHGTGWEISVPDGFKVDSSSADGNLRMIPVDMERIPLEIREGVNDDNNYGQEKWSYHKDARAAWALVQGTAFGQGIYADSGIVSEVIPIGFHDICAAILVQKDDSMFGGDYFNYICIIIGGQKTQLLEIDVVQPMTQEQRTSLDQSVKTWVESFRFDKPNQYVPKQAWFDDPRIIRDLKQNKMGSFNDALEHAVIESASVIGAADVLRMYSAAYSLPDNTLHDLKNPFEVLEFYYTKADTLLDKAYREGVPAKTLKKVYDKLLEELADIDKIFSQITCSSITKRDVPNSVHKMISKWKNDYKTRTVSQPIQTKQKIVPTKKDEKKQESKKKENQKLEQEKLNPEKEQRKAKRQLIEKQALEKYEKDYADWRQRCKEIDDIVKRNKANEKEYKRKFTAWEKECKAIDRKRKDETESRYLKEKERLENEVRENYEFSIKRIHEEKEKFIREKAEAEAALSKIRFFGFSKKKILQERIDNLNKSIADTEMEQEAINTAYLNNQKTSEEKIRSEISAQVNRSLPHPQMPTKEDFCVVPKKPMEPISPKKMFVYSKQNHKNIKVGSILYFGFYEPDSETQNNPEMMEWKVLANEKDRILIISRYGLGTKSYNQSYSDVDWETCLLRKWLNDDFFTEAFSEAEQELIITVTVPAEKNPKYNTVAGNKTKDKVFLLSIKEAEKYFLTDSDRVLNAKQYTTGKEAHAESDIKRWWLRTPGYHTRNAAYVNGSGVIDQFGYSVSKQYAVVRPAMWLKINRKVK